MSDMTAWEKFEYLRDAMGAEKLLDELARALSSDELSENCEFIARANDIDL